MNKKYSPLFQPWKIKNLEIKNKIVMTSMGGTSLFGWMEPFGNHFDKEAANFILQRAKNDVGLILPGIAPIRDVVGGKWLYKGKSKFKELKKFMDEVHKTGAKLFVQLTAGFGRSLAINDIMIKAYKNKLLKFLLKPILDVSYLSASASPTPNRWYNSVYSRQMTIKEINQIVDGFAKTARLCKEAGVDGIEVHAVHEGYLLDQFTMKYTNFRKDKYGGSFENRYRFPVEIVKAIKTSCGSDYPVSLRYSVVSKTKGFQEGALPNEKYKEVGRDLEEGIKAAKYLQDAGYDMLNCDNGTYDSWYWCHPPEYMPNNSNLKEVIALKKHIKIPLVCAGRMTPDVASDAIKKNQLDAMGVARQFLTDPMWVKKLKEDKEETIKPCICCHNACFNMASYKGVGNKQTLKDNAGMARCALNPETMQSKKYKIIKTKKPKKIAIIGAGIGGMESARLLTLRGHDVVVYEKKLYPGGIFVEAASPSFKEQDKKLLSWYKNEMKLLNINIIYNKEIKNLNDVKADEIIVATGALPRKINIKGINNSIEACEYLSNKKKVGNKVAVIGGGLTGCEVALDLYNAGKEPIIIESKNDLMATGGICLANTSYLRDFFKLHKVEIHLEKIVDEIKENEIIIKDKNNKKQSIKVDSIIRAIGYTPNPLGVKKTHFVGDCYRVGNLRTVIWRAWDVCMKI